MWSSFRHQPLARPKRTSPSCKRIVTFLPLPLRTNRPTDAGLCLQQQASCWLGTHPPQISRPFNLPACNALLCTSTANFIRSCGVFIFRVRLSLAAGRNQRPRVQPAPTCVIETSNLSGRRAPLRALRFTHSAVSIGSMHTHPWSLVLDAQPRLEFQDACTHTHAHTRTWMMTSCSTHVSDPEWCQRHTQLFCVLAELDRTLLPA
jgi:hypothetical protein